MRDLLSYTIRLLKSRSVRTMLTIFQVALGIWAVSLILSANFNIRAQINEATTKYGQNLLVVTAQTREEREDGSIQVRSQSVFNMEQIPQLKESSNIQRAYIVQNLGLQMSLLWADQTYRLQGLVGATADYLLAGGLELVAGDFFSELDVHQGNRVILISQTVARQLFSGETAVGRSIILDRAVGRMQQANVARRATAGESAPVNQGMKFEVIGVYNDMDELQIAFVDRSHGIIPLGSHVEASVGQTGGNTRLPGGTQGMRGEVLSDPQVLGRVQDMFQGFPRGNMDTAQALEQFLPSGSATFDSYPSMVIQAQSNQIHAAANDARVILQSVLLDNGDLAVEYVRDRNAELFSMVNQVIYFFFAFGFIAIVVSSVGILSVMMISVVERTRSIGLSRALGASRRWISRQFLAESILLSLVGAIVGLAVSYASADYVLESLLYKAFWTDLAPSASITLNPLAVLVSLIMAIFSGLVFGYFPAKEGGNLPPVEALRQG